MCWSEKCCFCVRLDLACVLIGGFSAILSWGLNTAILVYLIAERQDFLKSHSVLHHLLSAVHLDVDHSSKQIIFGIILFVSFFWMVTSGCLIYGVKRNVPGHVLSYFSFGVFLTFFAVLSSLLLLLSGAWPLAFALSGAACIQIHFNVVVHTFYELQLRGKVFVSRSEDDDEMLILDS